MTLTASTQNTATLTRERRLLCSSNKEPWGTNGLGLFIDLALIASFRDEVGLMSFRPRSFPLKNFVALKSISVRHVTLEAVATQVAKYQLCSKTTTG